MDLIELSRLITIYVGCFCLFVGICGNSINIFVFSTMKNSKKISSIFYFLIGSIINLIYILINLISRIISSITEYDLTRSSSVWCKIRQCCLATLCGIGLSCCCLSAMDQYLRTSNKYLLRRLSDIQWAHRFIVISLIVWCIHGILPLIAFDILPVSKTCGFISANWNIYGLVYFLGLITSIPVLIMIVFTYLTHRNIHKTIVLANQRADRQLRRMIFIEIVLVIIGFLPYGINSAYSLLTSNIAKDRNQLEKEYFLLTIVSLFPYIYYAVRESLQTRNFNLK